MCEVKDRKDDAVLTVTTASRDRLPAQLAVRIRNQQPD